MAKPHTAPLPPTSQLHDTFAAGDFLDCYAIRSPLPARAAAEIVAAFPGWVNGLVQLRNRLVAPFGLMSEAPEGSAETLGLFPVVAETSDEILAGFDDRHLNFLVSVSRHNGLIHLATWVRPHNFGGRAYLAMIMPFHIAVARNALRRVAASPPGPPGAPSAMA